MMRDFYFILWVAGAKPKPQRWYERCEECNEGIKWNPVMIGLLPHLKIEMMELGIIVLPCFNKIRDGRKFWNLNWKENK